MCINMTAQIHEGQQAGRKEGHLIGLYTFTFQKNRYYLCQQGLRSSFWRQKDKLLGLPVSERCGHSWWGKGLGRLVPHGLGDTWGWDGQGGASSFCPTSLQPAEIQSLLDPKPVALCQTEVPGATRALPGLPWELLPDPGCDSYSACFGQAELKPGWNLTMGHTMLKIRNSKFPQNLTKERVISCWTDGNDSSHGCGLGAIQHLWNKTCPFFSQKNAEFRSHRCLICMARIIPVQSIK